jgi:nicotinate-nucleotide--dimethylbenzimidazole phosphoribosyltransferase
MRPHFDWSLDSTPRKADAADARADQILPPAPEPEPEPEPEPASASAPEPEPEPASEPASEPAIADTIRLDPAELDMFPPPSRPTLSDSPRAIAGVETDDERDFFRAGDEGRYEGGPATLMPMAMDYEEEPELPRRALPVDPAVLARRGRFVRVVSLVVGAMAAITAVGLVRATATAHSNPASEPVVAAAAPLAVAPAPAPAPVREVAKQAEPVPAPAEAEAPEVEAPAEPVKVAETEAAAPEPAKPVKLAMLPRRADSAPEAAPRAADPLPPPPAPAATPAPAPATVPEGPPPTAAFPATP